MTEHPGTEDAPPGAGVLAWDARHRERGATSSVDPTVRGAVAGRTPGAAVDLACGTGRHARWLAHLGWRVTGVDSSPAGLELAAAAALAEGVDVTWDVADARAWSPLGPVDVVVGHALANAGRGVGGPRDPRLLHDPPAMAAAARTAGLVVHREGEVERPVDLGDEAGVQVDAVLVADRPGRPGQRRRDAGGVEDSASKSHAWWLTGTGVEP